MDIVGLAGKSPLQAAYKNMHMQQKSNQLKDQVSLMKQISMVVNNSTKSIDQRKLATRHEPSVSEPTHDPTHNRTGAS